MVKFRVCLQTNEVLQTGLDKTEASEAMCQLNTGEHSSDKIEKKYYLEKKKIVFHLTYLVKQKLLKLI